MTQRINSLITQPGSQLQPVIRTVPITCRRSEKYYNLRRVFLPHPELLIIVHFPSLRYLQQLIA